MLAPQPTDFETAQKFRGYTGVIGPLNGPCLRKGARPVFAGIRAAGKNDDARFQVGVTVTHPVFEVTDVKEAHTSSYKYASSMAMHAAMRPF
jgi:hypothetical protein